MDVTDPTTVRTRFLDTYAGPDRPHPYREHEQYALVLDHRQRHPRMGAQNIAKRIGLPEERVVAWLDGEPPASYLAAKSAAELGWFDLSWGGEQFRGLNVLVAWLSSSGRIDGDYVPVFTADDVAVSACTKALDYADVGGYEVRHSDDPDRVTELHVTDVAAVLGRLLVALGAVTASGETRRVGLPPYVAVAPEPVRRWFADVYLLNNGAPRPGRREPVAIYEERSRAYLESLVALYRSLCDGRVRLGGEHTVVLDEDALGSFDLSSKRFETAT
jgi:hypothetical protein